MFFIKSILLWNQNKCFVNIIKNIKYSTNGMKTIELKTCGQLYEELRKTNPKLYGNSPSDGLTISAEYVDTFCDNRSNSDVKTIVAIHGIPGYYYHFNDLIEYFSKKGSNVRVIVPNLPDFRFTRKTMAFWHSNKERSQFIRDFLSAINVSTIDCLISHSAGIHPISLIWTEPKELNIKSIGLFCPQPLWLTEYFFRLSKLFSYLIENKFGIKLMDIIRPHLIAHRMGYPMSYANVDEVMLTVMIASNGLDQQSLHQRLEYIKNNKIKTLVVYGERDKLILKTNFNRLVEDMGSHQTDFVNYSEDNIIEKDCERENYIKVLSFKSGGHFCFAKNSEEVNKHLVKHCLRF